LRLSESQSGVAGWVYSVRGRPPHLVLSSVIAALGVDRLGERLPLCCPRYAVVPTDRSFGLKFESASKSDLRPNRPQDPIRL
jgi:hypothetical protein